MMIRKAIGPLSRDQIILLLAVLKASDEFFRPLKADHEVAKLRQQILELTNIIAAGVQFPPGDLSAN